MTALASHDNSLQRPIADGTKVPVLVVCAGTRHCALPVAYVIETMRALPIEPMPAAPEFILGVSLIRGAPVPVVDLERCLGGKATAPRRFVTIDVGDRHVALAVTSVLGVQQVEPRQMANLPPLIAALSDAVERIGIADARLLTVLNAARLVADDVLSAVSTGPLE